MIPKRIFYVWGADEPKRRDVLACMQSWRQNCPDYEIIEINENSVDYFCFQNELQSNEWFRTVYQQKIWAYVADYIRIKALYNHGGIYLDTDVTVLKNFDDFLLDSAFVGMQDNSIDGKYDQIEPAILGSQKSNRVLKFIADIYQKDIWTLPIYSMPDLFNFALRQLYPSDIKRFPARDQQTVIEYPDIKIYPEKVFIPFRYQEKFSPDCITSETHTIHWWGASWIKPKILNFLKTKSRIPSQNTGYFRKISLFGLIPILKIFINENKIQIGSVTVLSILKNQENSKSDYSTIFELRLFGKIPLIKINSKEQGQKKKYYLFNILLFKSSI